jgi:hypothetical protein
VVAGTGDRLVNVIGSTFTSSRIAKKPSISLLCLPLRLSRLLMAEPKSWTDQHEHVEAENRLHNEPVILLGAVDRW